MIMTVEEFKNLKVGDYIYDTEYKDEWQVKSLCSNDYEFRFTCTKDGKSYKEGEVEKWGTESAYCFTLGRHPDNIKTEPEQELFVNTYESEEGEFYIGGVIFDCKIKAFKGKSQGYKYTAKLVPVEVEQTFIPKHGEKCRFESLEGVISECEAVEIKGKLYAYYESNRGGSRIYYPSEIKQFLPL